jgi:FkbM family methyltransferase
MEEVTMRTPYVTNPVIASVLALAPFRRTAFRGYNFIAKRLNQQFTAKTYFGAAMMCNPNDYIQRMIFNFGFWEPDISAYIQKTLGPGDVFVDGGANIGYYTLLAATVIGKTGAVVAIEAAQKTFRLLLENVTRNKFQNVRAINVAASDRHGQFGLFSRSDASIGEMTTVASRGFDYCGDVTAAPLSEIIPALLTSRVRMVKVDIEGGEIAVMNDLLTNIERYSPRLQVIAEVSVNESRSQWEDVICRMRAGGFSVYSLTNDYDDDAYLNWQTPSAPELLNELPTKQFDILFRRD